MSAAARSPEGTWPGQIRALPARITHRVGRFRRTRARLTCIGVPGIYTFTGITLPAVVRTARPWWSRPVRADICSMFARDVPVRPGSTRYLQHAGPLVQAVSRPRLLVGRDLVGT